MSRLLVIGGGGFGRAVADAVLAGRDFTLAGFVDDRWPELAEIWGVPVLGRLSDLPALHDRAGAVTVAIGDNEARRAAYEQAARLGFEWASIVHPRAHLSSRLRIGRGVTVMAGAIIGVEAQLDDGVIVNAGAIVDHHARMGAYAHLGIGACMAGGSVLEAGAWLQEGRTLAPGEIVGQGRVVARLSI